MHLKKNGISFSVLSGLEIMRGSKISMFCIKNDDFHNFCQNVIINVSVIELSINILH